MAGSSATNKQAGKGGGQCQDGRALEALAQLAPAFPDQPDFEKVIELLLLTLGEQFAAESAFALIRWPLTPTPQSRLFATGRFAADAGLSSLCAEHAGREPVCKAGGPCLVRDLSADADHVWCVVLAEAGVEVVMPLLHEDRFLGLIGLGRKTGGAAFSPHELQLFATLSRTITLLTISSILLIDLAQMNNWYQGVFNSVKQAVFIFDPGRHLKKVNAAGVAMVQALTATGVDADALEGRLLTCVFTDDVFPGWASRMEAPLGAQHARFLENLVARGRESERVYHVRVATTAGAGTREGDLVVTLDDVSVEKENEHRLYELQKFAEKGMMASSIAHDLNNYLAMILGGVELAQMVLGRGQTERVQTSLEKLKTTVARMERFTTGLMDYAHLKNERRPTNLNAVISDVLSFVAVQKRFKRIRIDTSLDPALPQRIFDPDQFAQLLLNFLNNAADAIAEVDREQGRITISTAVEHERIVVSVADNGAGAPAEVAEQLFKHHLTTKPNGHGYGLVTCARIIRAHQGEYAIESEVGRGTTFRLSFPLVETDAADAGAAAAPPVGNPDSVA
jgi:signal transduction histidine kinase